MNDELKNVKVSKETHELMKEISKNTGLRMFAIAERAIHHYANNLEEILGYAITEMPKKK